MDTDPAPNRNDDANVNADTIAHAHGAADEKTGRVGDWIDHDDR